MVRLPLDGVRAAYLMTDDLTFMGDVVRDVTVGVIRQYPAKWKMAVSMPGSKTVVYQRVGSEPRPNTSAPSTCFICWALSLIEASKTHSDCP